MGSGNIWQTWGRKKIVENPVSLTILSIHGTSVTYDSTSIQEGVYHTMIQSAAGGGGSKSHSFLVVPNKLTHMGS